MGNESRGGFRRHREDECQGDRQLRTAAREPANVHHLRWVNKRARIVFVSLQLLAQYADLIKDCDMQSGANIDTPPLLLIFLLR